MSQPAAAAVNQERLGAEDLRRQADYFSDDFITRHLLDAIPNVLLILNSQRQIVYANRTLSELTAFDDQSPLSGLRPGEALHCIHAGKAAAGCGAAEHCRACGLLDAILECQTGGREPRDCRVTRYRNGLAEALDLRVRATPLTYGGESFTLFSVVDISHEKRRQALERIFFHDILNLAGGIRGFAEILPEAPPQYHAELTRHIREAAERVIDEILAQRTLAAAESQDLHPQPGPVVAPELLGQLVASYRHHEVAQGRQVRISEAAETVALISDATLLGRVLGNMLKNALEAVPPGAVVTAGCRGIGDEVEFWVHNPGVIPEPVRLQIFQRSFSTRGVGRGLGTYSMRLLSEEYLHGRVTFRSSRDEGTTFSVRLPRHWPTA